MRGLVPAPGTLVWIRQQPWRVARAQLDRGVVRLDVVQGARTLTFLAPFDRPARVERRLSPVRAGRRHARATVARVMAGTAAFDTPIISRDARLDILPHQLEPVLAVLAGRRRLLIADAVGLGKTIQAGLVLAELHRRRLGFRALVVAPATLVDQWIDELQTRFGLRAERADREALGTSGRECLFGTSPWARSGIWVASPDYVKQPHVFDALPSVPWDVVVIDEAHTVVGPSERQTACAELGRRARHLLLLTATPHSGDESRFDRLLRLGAWPESRDDLAIFQRSRGDAGVATTRTVRWRRVALSADALRVHDALAHFERTVLGRSSVDTRDQAVLLLSVFRKRALSTFYALHRSLGRRLEWLETANQGHQLDWLQPRLNFEDDDELNGEERVALIAESGLALAQERAWIRRLQALARAATPHDAKIARLTRLVARARQPVVIFTEYRDSLEHVRRHLEHAHTVAALHGDQDPAQRRHSIQQFLDGRATVLLSTDVGGQGLNLQTRARWVIILELPWNPIRLEQRIGRVDRIGQRRRVHATILVARHDAEEGVLATLARRALFATRAVGPHTFGDFTPPAPRAVAEALITGAEIKTPSSRPSTAIVRAMQWRRRARAVARVVIRQRVLRQQWRGPIDVPTRPRLVRSARGTAGHTETDEFVVLVTIPIVDGTGAVLERHAVALRVAAPFLIGDSLGPAAIGQAATNRVRARLVRVGRALTVSTQRRVESEYAIARHLSARRAPGAAQPDLFGMRAARQIDEDRRHADAAMKESERVIRGLRDSLRIEVGAVFIEVIWPGRS